MYLSTKQHDKLRTIIMNVEIPYRAFVADKIITHYRDFGMFDDDIKAKSSGILQGVDGKIYDSEFGKIKSNTKHVYEILNNSKKSIGQDVICEDIKVPNISQINTLVITLNNIFMPMIYRFGNIETFWKQAYQYKNIRNKLDHPGTKTLEKNDMNIVLDFILNICGYILDCNEKFFYEKSYNEIEKEIIALQTEKIKIPLEYHNIDSMPFSDMKLVCRNNEINQIKDFIYGKPGAIRKKSSYCVYGYGGVGKTALVLETVKSIVQDLQDNRTVNNYKADYILFLSAKEKYLDISQTSGEIIESNINKDFSDCKEFVDCIFNELHIQSFNGFNKTGIVIVDNLESLSRDERERLRDIICYQTPQNMQFILTSRNEEDYDIRTRLSGFEGEFGECFIKEYISENGLDLNLSSDDINTLLDICKGNTLVLVLCLQRLSYNVDNIHGIVADLTFIPTVNKLSCEFDKLPYNGYDIISEFMYKNTFTEIENILKSKLEIIHALLKVFAVYTSNTIDLYTLSMLTDVSVNEIEKLINILCRYLIVNKQNSLYSLNQFAEKYIVQRFLPDSETRSDLLYKIEKNTRKAQSELQSMQNDVNNNESLKRLIADWNIITDGDKISAARAFGLYRRVASDCQRGSKFHIESAMREAIDEINKIEKNTMHPYVRFQKARIYQKINETKILSENLEYKMLDAYEEVIWVIKNNPIYDSIRGTKSYPSVLWLYGTQLLSIDNEEKIILAIRYLEEAKKSFEQLAIEDNEYYQCFTRLGYAYLSLYEKDHRKYITYLRKSRSVSNQLYGLRVKYNKKIRRYSIELHNKLLKYGQF